MNNLEKNLKVIEPTNEELGSFKINTSEFGPERKADMHVVRENNEINPSNATIEEVIENKKKEIQEKLKDEEETPFDKTIEEANASKNKEGVTVNKKIATNFLSSFLNKIKNNYLKIENNVKTKIDNNLINKGEAYLNDQDNYFKQKAQELKDTDLEKYKKYIITLGKGGYWDYNDETKEYKPGGRNIDVGRLR